MHLKFKYTFYNLHNIQQKWNSQAYKENYSRYYTAIAGKKGFASWDRIHCACMRDVGPFLMCRRLSSIDITLNCADILAKNPYGPKIFLLVGPTTLQA